jgi:hypothetical protein
MPIVPKSVSNSGGSVSRADASLQLVLRRMDFVVPSCDLALPVDQDGGVIDRPPARTRIGQMT